MLTNRYIQAVLGREIAEDIKHDPATLDQCERAVRAAEQRDRAEQLSFRFVDLDRRFGI